MLSRDSLEQSSIFYYLKEGPLALKYSQDVIQAPLIFDNSLDKSGTVRTDYRIVDPSSAFADIATSEGRGWVSFEPLEPDPCKIYNVSTSGYVDTFNTNFDNSSFIIPSERESSLIVVRDQDGDVIPRDYYQIDYKKGRIRWPAPGTPSGALSDVPTTIDYRFHLASLIDGFPTAEDCPALPVVAFYPLSSEPCGYQIGPGVKFENNYAIDVFATSNAELRQLMSLLYTSLYHRNIPVIDFNRTGEPLTFWGVINPNFIQDIDYDGEIFRSYLTLNPGNGNLLYLMDVEAKYHTLARHSRSDLVRHSGRITFTTKTLSDRDPKLVGKFSNLNPPPGGFDSLIKQP